MNWYLEDLSLWPRRLTVKHAEVVAYRPFGDEDRIGVVIDVAPADPETGEERVMVEFYEGTESWVLPVSALTSLNKFDIEKAGTWYYPTLADGSIVRLRLANSTVLAETLGLWCTGRHAGVLGYCVKPIGSDEAVFAEFGQIEMP